MSKSEEKALAAADELGLKLEGLTDEQLAVAFRYKVMEAHPDKGGTAEVVQTVYQAKATLQAWLDNLRKPPADPNCPACDGAGHTIMRRGFRGSLKAQCRQCNGRGTLLPV